MSERSAADRRLRERARQLARPPEQLVRPGTQHLLVGVAGTRLAVPVADLRQTVGPGPVAGLPGLPPELPGVRSLRGEVVCLADTAAVLGLAARREPSEQHVVVLDGACPLGLLVDEVLGLVELQATDLSPAPATEIASPVLTGVTVTGTLVLDPDAVLADPRLDLSTPSSHPEGPS